jgi:hypothetical protein
MMMSAMTTNSFETRWVSKKFDENFSRAFDNKEYALRHAEDMHSWGYDVEVIFGKEVLLRKSHTPEKKTPQFKEGDKARIVKNICAHGFKTGTIVTLIKDAGGWKAYKDENRKSDGYWYFLDSEIEEI